MVRFLDDFPAGDRDFAGVMVEDLRNSESSRIVIILLGISKF